MSKAWLGWAAAAALVVLAPAAEARGGYGVSYSVGGYDGYTTIGYYDRGRGYDSRYSYGYSRPVYNNGYYQNYGYNDRYCPDRYSYGYVPAPRYDYGYRYNYRPYRHNNWRRDRHHRRHW